MEQMAMGIAMNHLVVVVVVGIAMNHLVAVVVVGTAMNHLVAVAAINYFVFVLVLLISYIYITNPEYSTYLSIYKSIKITHKHKKKQIPIKR